MAKNKIEIKEIVQNILDEDFGENVEFDPENPERYYVTNVVRRTLAHLVGRSPTGDVVLKCNAAGELVVATGGSFISGNDVKLGNAPDAYGAALVFDVIVSRTDIFVSNNPVVVKRSIDGVFFYDEFFVPADSMYSIDANTHSIMIKNFSAGDIGTYSIVGWY